MSKIDTFTHIGFKEPHQEVEMCEDRVIVNEQERVYGVIDGATSTSGVKIEGLTDGAFMAEFFNKEINKGGFITMTAEAILSEINERFGKYLEEKYPDVAKLGKRGPCGSGVLVKVHRNGTFSYAQIGDCMLIEVTQEGGFVELTTDTRFEDDLIYLNKALEISKEKNLPILDVRQYPEVIEKINEHRDMSNVKKGVITGEVEMDKFIVSGVRDLENAKSLMMMSDGMAHPNFGKEETYIQAAKQMQEKGIEGYYTYIKKLFDEDNDWHNLKYLRCKHIDDASAVVLSF